MNAHSRRWVLISLAATVLAVTSTAVIAQWYPDSDPRSSNYQQYLQQQRTEFDKRQRDEEARNKAHAEEMYGQKPSSPSGGSQYNAQTQADLKAARARLLKMAPLPDARNPLLGRWRIEGAGRSRKKDDMSTLMGMLNNPGGAMCETLFGSGVTRSSSQRLGRASTPTVTIRSVRFIIAARARSFGPSPNRRCSISSASSLRRRIG